MKRLRNRVLLGAALVLCACGGLPTPTPQATVPALTHPSATAAMPTDQPATPTALPCDPAATFCLQAGHFLLQRPIAPPGTVKVDINYLFGTTEDGTRQPHHGDDIENASGTPVLAAADGKVVVAGSDRTTAYGPTTDFYGNLVVLEHHLPGIPETIYTLYGHLSAISVQAGQQVRAGEVIGAVGATGEAIGSHLHFEVRAGADSYSADRNPLLWLRPLADAAGAPLGVLAGRVTDAQGHPLHVTSLLVQYFPDPAGPPRTSYSVETYAPESEPVQGDDAWQENFVLGDLPAGTYRLSLVWAGALLERRVQVHSGLVTEVTFVAK